MSDLAAIKWHGGKHYLARKIVELMPPHVHYVEPFAGGLAVLLAKDPQGISEVVNDLDGSLINFWRVLADENLFAQFQRRIEAVPFSEPHWMEANGNNGFPVQLAVAFFIRCRQSLAGRMDRFAPLSRNRTRRGMNEQASAWLTAVEGLPAVHERLKRVAIVGPKDAKEVIRQQDGTNTLFYLDPPYLNETRSTPNVYNHEMSRDEHSALLAELRHVKGKVLLSGYDSQLYRDRLEGSSGWNRHVFELPNNAAGGDSKRTMTEIVWTNF